MLPKTVVDKMREMAVGGDLWIARLLPYYDRCIELEAALHDVKRGGEDCFVGYVVNQTPGQIRKFVNSPALAYDMTTTEGETIQILYKKTGEVELEPYTEEDE